MNFKKDLSALVLDIDGTLVDSNDQHARSWCEALEEKGFRAPYETVRRLIGMGGDKLFPRVTGLSQDTDIGKETSKYRGELLREKYLEEIKPFKGTRDLVLRAQAAGLKVAIATSASEKDLKILLKIAEVDDLIDLRASSSDAERSKPDPGIVQAALDLLKLPKERVVMVGDTPYDIEAAGQAGIRTLAFRSGGAWSDDDLVGALEIFDGPWELAERF